MAVFRISWLLYVATIVSNKALVVASNRSSSQTKQAEKYHVPVFSVSELEAGSRAEELANVLSTTGLISIYGTTGDLGVFSDTRQLALQGLCECMVDNNDLFASVQGSDSSLLSDGTTRKTIATATIGNTPLPLQDKDLLDAGCSSQTIHSMDALRDQVSWISHSFVSVLDRIMNESSDTSPLIKTSKGVAYSTLTSIVDASQNLEHFHVYDKKGNSRKKAVLDVHTDAGLFLAFSPGMICTEGQDSSSDLFIKHDGMLKEAVFSEGTVGIMLGVGAEHWLRAPVKLSATRHAVTLQAGQRRAWYGMMHTVPQDALIQEFPKRTFADMRVAASSLNGRNARTYGDARPEGVDIEEMSIGCGTSSRIAPSAGGNATRINRRRLQHVDSNACNNITSFYCWNSCLDIPEADSAVGFITEGYSLYCLDPATLASTGNRVSSAVEPCNEGSLVGGSHNQACIGSWQPTAPGVSAQEVIVDESLLAANDLAFCYGGTSMYMDGFHWTDTTCVIYLFPGWVLSSAGALVGASIGTIFAAVALEGIIYKRRNVVKAIPSGNKRLAVSSMFYGLQLTLGYMLMLVVMTYSGPLFMCVVLGLVGGHYTFSTVGAKAEARAKVEECCGMQGGGSTSSEKSCDDPCVPEGSTPCCQNTL